MSKGHGWVQREIVALIAAAKPDDGWSLEEVCRRVYGDENPSRAQLSAAKRALRMRLPGSWRTGQTWPDRTWWLYDASNVDWRMMIEPFELVDIETLAVELPET
jgi:hypothetical protein